MPTYEEALKYLDSFTNYEQIGLDDPGIQFDLEKLKNVLEKMGNPHGRWSSVHVAGTKGNPERPARIG